MSSEKCQQLIFQHTKGKSQYRIASMFEMKWSTVSDIMKHSMIENRVIESNKRRDRLKLVTEYEKRTIICKIEKKNRN